MPVMITDDQKFGHQKPVSDTKKMFTKIMRVSHLAKKAEVEHCRIADGLSP